MRIKVWSLFLSCILLLLPATLSAHHSFVSEYDGTKPVALNGVLTKIEWTNPHSHFYMDVKNADGTVENWKFEGFPPNMLVHNGWKRDTMKVGDTITVFGWRAKDGTTWAQAREVTLADGSKFLVGPGTGDDSGRAKPPTN